MTDLGASGICHGFYEIMRRKWMEQEKELSSLGSDTDK